MNLDIKVAIIAALAAILGAAISQITTFAISIFDKKHQRKVLLRQKYEEMMFHFSASLVWIQCLNGSTSEATNYSLAQSTDARKALSLCLLYFPDLVEAANNYILVQQSYYESIIIVFDKKSDISAGAQAILKNPKYLKAQILLFKNKDIFEHLIISMVEKYTMA